MSRRDYEGPSLDDDFSHFEPKPQPTKAQVEEMLKKAKAALAQAKKKPESKLKRVDRELKAIDTSCSENPEAKRIRMEGL